MMKKVKAAIVQANSKIKYVPIASPTKEDPDEKYLYIPKEKPIWVPSTLRLKTPSSAKYKEWEANLPMLFLCPVVDCILEWLLLVHSGKPVLKPVTEIQQMAKQGFLLSIDMLREHGVIKI